MRGPMPAGPEHIDGILAIERECFAVPWTREGLCAYLPDDMHLLVVYVDENGEPMGYIGLMYVLDEGYISNVAVSPKHRRQGIADAMLTYLTEAARERDLSFLTLEVRRSNAPAIALYEKNGFEKVGIRKKYYEKPTEDAIIMTKLLK